MFRFSLIIIGILFLAGCTQDPVYEKAKTIYIKGKKVVIKNWNYLPDDIKNKLKAIDTVAKGYDKLHSKIFKHKDVNTTLQQKITK